MLPDRYLLLLAFAGSFQHTCTANEHSDQKEHRIVTPGPCGLQIREAGSPSEDHWLSFIGLQRQGRQVTVWTDAVHCSDGQRDLWMQNDLEVHYTALTEGVRQDFLIQHKPFGNGPLDVILDHSDLHPLILNGTDAHLLDGTGHFVFSYTGLRAWDACGSPLQARMIADTVNGRLLLRVDDRVAEYPIMIDPVATTHDVLLLGTASGGRYGRSVNTAGDLNGDGYSDVVIGAREASNGQASEGLVFVHYGSSIGIGIAPDVVLEIDQASASFGNSVSTAGDINGDGFSDLIVGAPNWESDAATLGSEGAIFIYYGSAAGIGAVPNVTRRANSAAKYMGWSVACAGDINNDGYSDIITGGWLATYGQSNEGAAWVFLGGAAGLAATPVHRLERNQGGAQFGATVAGAGDVNGDGYSDVVVGSHAFDINVANDGATFVYHGGPTNLGAGLNPAPATTFTGPAGSQRSAWSVSCAGDVNGDGYSDIITGHYLGSIGGPTEEGAAFVHLGSPTGVSTTPATIIDGGQASAWMGRSVAGAGDVNGDGFGDVLVGAVTYTNGQALEGAAFLYLGSSAGVSNVFHRRFELNFSGANVGECVATAGDVNGDGFSDMIVGAENYGGSLLGAAAIYHGGTEYTSVTPSAQWTYSQTNALAGWCVAHAGDLNGDGYSDVAIGAKDAASGQAGEGLVFVHYGSTTGIGTVPDLTLQINVAGAGFGACVNTAGDVNGDGYADLAVGAPLAGGTGRVDVFLGGPAGLSPVASWTRAGTVGSAYGTSVMTAGDVNSDGFADLIIGGPQADLVDVFLGSATGLAVGPHVNFSPPSGGIRFGYAVSTAGDVNGDGHSDVIIGAPGFSNGQLDEGAAFVYHGSDTGLIDVIDRQIELNVASSQMGISVAGVGDVNGDGFDEVALGGDLHSAGQVNEGRVSIFRGSATGITTALGSFFSNVDNARLGFSVAEAGDVNGDGYADVVAGAPFQTQSLNEQGRVYLWHGSPTGLVNQRLITGTTADARFGWSVAGAGDVDGDGYTDVLVGTPYDAGGSSAEGRVFWYRGNNAGSIDRLTRQYLADLVSPLSTNSLDMTTTSVFGLGHRTRSHIQRTNARLCWEVVFEGQPFSGSPITNSVLASGCGVNFLDLTSPGIEIKELIAKAPGHIRYKWRVRPEYTLNKLIDGQRYGRWFYGFVSGTGDIGILPIDLVDLFGTPTSEGNVLQWSTASEHQSERFIVERSRDLLEFVDIGSVPAAGESHQLLQYELLDERAPQGLSYYRLRMIDLDGSWEHSEIISVQRATGQVSIHPNPVEQFLTWSGADAAVIEVLDVLGRVVLIDRSNGPESGPLDVSILPMGTYTLRLSDGNNTTLGTTRFVKSYAPMVR